MPKLIHITCAIFLFSACSLSFTGCAMIKRQDAKDTQLLLLKSGFLPRHAQTPEHMARLKTLTQRKIVRHENNDAVEYVYADARFCECVYVGSEEAYQNFIELFKRQKAIENERIWVKAGRQERVNWGGLSGMY